MKNNTNRVTAFVFTLMLISAPAFAQTSSTMPSEVESKLRTVLTIVWPGNTLMQQAVFEGHAVAYGLLATMAEPTDMPRTLFHGMKQHVGQQWALNFQAQYALLTLNVEAYRDLKTYAPGGVPASEVARIKTVVAIQSPLDYAVQKVLADAHVVAYLAAQGQRGVK